MADLTKKDLEHLAALARIDLSAKGGSASGGKEGEEEKLLKDLGNILAYFKELQELDTTGVVTAPRSQATGVPAVGLGSGTSLKNVLREDVAGGTDDTGKGPEQFPDKKDGYLRVPPVF